MSAFARPSPVLRISTSIVSGSGSCQTFVLDPSKGASSSASLVLFSKNYIFHSRRRIQTATAKVTSRASPATSTLDFVGLEGKPKSCSTKVNDPIWIKGVVPQGYWVDKSNQRKYLDWLGEKLNFTTKDAWYKIKKEDFVRNRGRGIMEQYRNSPSLTVVAVFSDHEFLPWLFDPMLKGYFRSRSNRQRYIDWVMKKVGVSAPEKLETNHFLENHGESLVKKFGGGSPQAVIASLRNDESIERVSALGRAIKPRNYWQSMENQRELLDSIGAQIGVKSNDLSPWYCVTREALVKFGCAGILTRDYNYSPYRMLRKVYPEHDWIPWKFKNLPHPTSIQPEAFKRVLDHIEMEKEISKPEDWYRITQTDLRNLGVGVIIEHMGGLYQALKEHRSDFPWEEGNFSKWKTLGKKRRTSSRNESKSDSDTS